MKNTKWLVVFLVSSLGILQETKSKHLVEFSLTSCHMVLINPTAQQRPGLHQSADPGLPLPLLAAPLVPDHHGLVPEAAVPGRLAAAQVGGGRSCLQLLLLLLPDQQGRVPVPQPGKRLRQGLLSQRGPAWTRTRAGTSTGLGLYSRRVAVRHV